MLQGNISITELRNYVTPYEEYIKASRSKPSVYEVEVTINNVVGYKEKKEKYEFTKKFNVLAQTEFLAVRKAATSLYWENHEKLEYKTFNIDYQSKLIVENVEY